jgi:hypothetical protein
MGYAQLRTLATPNKIWPSGNYDAPYFLLLVSPALVAQPVSSASYSTQLSLSLKGEKEKML